MEFRWIENILGKVLFLNFIKIFLIKIKYFNGLNFIILFFFYFVLFYLNLIYLNSLYLEHNLERIKEI